VVDLKQDTPDTERLKSGNVFAPLVAPPPTPTVAPPPTTAPPMRTVAHCITTAHAQPTLMAPTPTEAPPMRAVDECVCTTAHAQVLPQIEPKVTSEGQLVARRQAEQTTPATPWFTLDQTDEMNTAATCRSCGIEFQTPYFLERHQFKGCSMEDDDDSDEDDQYAWFDLVNQAYDSHEKLYAEKAADLEDEGLNDKDLEDRVTETLMPLYRKSLINGYKKLMVQMHDLNTNPYHKQIMQMVNWYVEC
jgi:hypothetical protein